VPSKRNRHADAWQEFREDAEPIGVEELKRLNLKDLPEDVQIPVLDDHFPETTIRREGEQLVCEIQEHLYTKYWEHKFSAYAFAEAMERAVRRLIHEGHPFAEPSRDDEDVHIFVRWQLKLRRDAQADLIAKSIKSAFDLVWHRADLILENSDSVLILGKDSGAGLDRLKRIENKLHELGYYTYIIKEQLDKPGEGVIQKVMRYALSSKFVLIENTEASGHLYEIPHVTKAAECVTVVLQEEGKGATWMFGTLTGNTSTGISCHTKTTTWTAQLNGQRLGRKSSYASSPTTRPPIYLGSNASEPSASLQFLWKSRRLER
jgi:hypothetical protein